SVLRRVFELADVHEPGWSGCGCASPARLVRAPGAEQKWSRSAGHCLGVMDHEIAVHVPIDITGSPDNFEVVSIPLVEPGDLRVLKVGYAMPVSAIHGVR